MQDRVIKGAVRMEMSERGRISNIWLSESLKIVRFLPSARSDHDKVLTRRLDLVAFGSTRSADKRRQKDAVAFEHGNLHAELLAGVVEPPQPNRRRGKR